MFMSGVRIALPMVCVLAAVGCSGGPNFVAREEPWRAEEERQCLAANVVRESAFVQSRSALGGPSVCGALRPYEMSAADNGRVLLRPAALLRCPMVPQVDHWVVTVVEPAARYYFGSSLLELKIAASYACRPMNNVSGGRLSEHGHANALDVSGFMLADGRMVTVKSGWRGGEREQAFLRAVHSGSCRTFTTVLGPNYDRNHHDHFHLDLARHGHLSDGRICK